MAQSTLADILSPATLARIDNYQLLARVVVEGFIAGLHRSVYRGFGSEFLQYRSYTPGDDLKYIDWKVYGRQNRFYTKVFQEETNMNCTLVLDASRSMTYRGTRAACTKYRYGAMIAACLAYLAKRQGDNVGFFSYGDKLHASVPPANRSGHLQQIAIELERTVPDGKADHRRFIPYIGESLRRRGLVVFISDLLESETFIQPLLKQLTFARHECIVIQVLDPDELDLPFDRTVRFFDSESNEQIITAPPSVRDEYAAAMQRFLDQIRRSCRDIQVDHLLCDSSSDLGAALAAYLHKRGGVY